MSKKLGSTDLSIKVFGYNSLNSERFNLSSLPVEDINSIASGEWGWGGAPSTVSCGFKMKYFYAEAKRSGYQIYATNYYNNELHSDTFAYCLVSHGTSLTICPLIINEDNFVLNQSISSTPYNGYIFACG